MRDKLGGIRFAMAALLVAPVLLSAAGRSGAPAPTLEQKVRHELVMLPYYNLFDNLSFRVEDGRVTLLGQVCRPMLKSDAEGVVKRIAGVTAVDNQIEVLPLSRFDDNIRWRVARAVYGQGSLQRYAMGAVPQIHIIVKNGAVTLEGSVISEMDRNIAGIQANHVPGVFAVTNNLQVNRKS